MKYKEIYEDYKSQLIELNKIVEESSKKAIDDENSFFNRHANFLVKSYLISLCSHLETFIKLSASEYIEQTKLRLQQAKLPRNLIIWSVLMMPIKQEKKMILKIFPSILTTNLLMKKFQEVHLGRFIFLEK